MSLGNISFRRSREAKLALLTALAIGVYLGPFAAAQQKQPAQNNRPAQRREENDIPRKRIEWFHKQRAFPLGFIPTGARLKALQHLDRMVRGAPGRQAGSTIPDPAPPSPSTTTWTLIGPQPINAIAFPPFTAGRITALAADPADPFGNTVYAGGAQGGIWKTTDGGMSWKPLTDGQPSLATGSIAIAPSNSSIVYVGTGEQAGLGFDVYYGAGVLKSTDGGTTWTQTGTPPGAPFVGPFGPGFFPGGGARIGSLAVNPTNPNLVLAGVQMFTSTDSGPGTPGIYCTDNGGSTWANVLPGAMGTAVVYATATVAYAALGRFIIDTENDVYKSMNANGPCSSITWTRIHGTGSTALPAQTSLGRIELGVAPSNPNIVYAAIANAANSSNNLLGMFVTMDGGTTWTQLSNTPNFCNPQCWFDNVVRVHPLNQLLVFIGGAAVGSTGFSTLFGSADGGISWTDISTGANGVRLHVDHHALAFAAAAGTKLYVGNDGGVWSAANLSTTSIAPPNWSNLNSSADGLHGLAIAQFYPGHSIHPSNQLIGFGGTQDNGTLKFNNDFAWTEQNVCGDGGWTAIDPAVPSTVYAACVDININKSVQNGASFFPVDAAIAASADNVNFVPPLVIDPANSQRLYFGTFRVWQSTDGGGTWALISSDLTAGGGSAANGPTLSTIAVAPGNSSVVYVGSDDGKVHVAFNAAAGSATFSDMSTGLPPRSITQIAIDPGNPQTAYVTFSGFSGQFTNPAPPPPTIGDTQGHVFKTINGGASWTDVSCSVLNCAMPASTDLPNTPVNDIVIDPDAPNTVYVATDIGVFKTSNANPGTTWSPVFPAMPGTPGLPRVAVFSLKLHEPSRTLRAATHGRSVWDLQLGNIPAFNLSSISPTSTPSGTAGLTLTVKGNGFTQSPLSTVKWNGAAQPTTFVTGNQLTASITANLLTNPGTAQVTVDQSGGTGPISNALVFSITGLVPVLNSVTPNSAPAGSGNTSITLSGSDFASNAQVFWNGSPNGVTTNPAGPSCQGTLCTLTATLASSLLTFGSIDTVTVVNPAPGGGPSKPGVSFTVTQTMLPPNDFFVNATPVTSSNFSNTVDNFAATTESTDPTPPCVNVPADTSNPRTKTVWWKFTAGGNGSLTADTIGSPYDTLLSVWTGTQGNLVAVPNGCNDDIIPGIVQQSRVMITVTAGTTYYFMIGPLDPLEPGGLGAGGKTVFNVSTSVLPASLAAMPSSATINAGQLASFTILVANGALASPVTLSVTGCPPASTCTLGSTSVSVGNSTSLNIATTARAVVPLEPPSGPKARRRPLLPSSWFVLALLALLAATLAARAAKRPRMAAYLPLVALVLLLASQAIGCGGGGGGGGGGAGGGTTAGTYILTITGTSGGMQQSTTVTLIVR